MTTVSESDHSEKHDRETLSAVLDGESEMRMMLAVSRRVGSDVELRRTLPRYQMIGESLRGEPVNLEAERLVEAVSRRLEDEPTILAPQPVRRGSRRWLQPVAGAAIAASVAAAGIMLAPRFLGGSRAPGGPGVAGTAPVYPVVATPVSQGAVAARGVTPRTMRWKTVDGRVEEPPERRFDRYLREHSRYATGNGLQGMIPYTTLVGYESSYTVEDE